LWGRTGGPVGTTKPVDDCGPCD